MSGKVVDENAESRLGLLISHFSRCTHRWYRWARASPGTFSWVSGWRGLRLNQFRLDYTPSGALSLGSGGDHLSVGGSRRASARRQVSGHAGGAGDGDFPRPGRTVPGAADLAGGPTPKATEGRKAAGRISTGPAGWVRPACAACGSRRSTEGKKEGKEMPHE